MNLVPEDFTRVGRIITTKEAFPPHLLVDEVADYFFNRAELDAVAIVEDARPIGLVTRTKFLFTVFRRFGWELFGREPIVALADKQFLPIDRDVRLDEALEKAIKRPSESVYDELVIVGKDGEYEGLLSVRQMVIQHSHSLANILLKKDLADARAQELERMSELKSQFLANVTHELRSPVNAIIELSELIRISADRGYVNQVQDRLSLLLSSATNLRSIITNILDLSKIEAGKMKVIDERFDLIPLLREIVETARVLAGSKPVDVALDAEDDHVEMFTDPVKVRQIVMNLMSNAVKFTESGRISLAQRIDGDQVVISVRDTGVGIREQDLSLLFEAFSQVEDASTKMHDGTGLGLAITRELLALLEGSITVDSEYGKGSTFTTRLPIRRAQ